MKTNIIVIGASQGGVKAINTILKNISPQSHMAILIVLHIGNNDNTSYITNLNKQTQFKVKEADEKEIIEPGIVYFAPPNYHLMIEEDGTLSLSTSPKENYSRPSIDVLFETAAWAFREQLIGVLLTGASSDGAKGIETINKYGGTTIVENPDTAFSPIMPQAAINLSTPDYIANLDEIAQILLQIRR